MENSEIIIKTLEKENELLKENMSKIREKDLQKYLTLQEEKNSLLSENEALKNENAEIRNQLDSILYSRSYRFTQKIKNVIKR
jgi:hypothetical protein